MLRSMEGWIGSNPHGGIVFDWRATEEERAQNAVELQEIRSARGRSPTLRPCPQASSRP